MTSTAAHSDRRMMMSSSAWSADHEFVAADVFEAMALIKAPRPMIVDEHAEEELVRQARAPRRSPSPSTASAMPAALTRLEQVELVEFACALRARSSTGRSIGPSLRKPTGSPSKLGNAEGESADRRTRSSPGIGRELVEEGREILRADRDAPNVSAEARRGRAGRSSAGPRPRIAVSDCHSNPAGTGQSGEWIAITLNSSPIWSAPVRR